MKLDLAAGMNPREDFQPVDIERCSPETIVCDLLMFPWPWETSSVDELHCSHFIEHIPMHEYSGKDWLVAFIDECYRVLKPGGLLTLRWPDYRHVHAFMDPTHRRFIPLETLGYFQKTWRELNRLQHYRIDSDWEPVAVKHTEAENQVILRALK